MSMLGSVIKGLLQQIIESTPFPTDLHDCLSNFVGSELVRLSVCSRIHENVVGSNTTRDAIFMEMISNPLKHN